MQIVIILLYVVIFALVRRFLKGRKVPYVKFLTYIGLFALFVLIVLFLFM